MERKLAHNSDIYLNILEGIDGLFFTLTMYTQNNEEINQLIKRHSKMAENIAFSILSVELTER